MLHMTMLGWLRLTRTRLLISRRYHFCPSAFTCSVSVSSKKRAYPFLHLGIFHISKLSAITIMPISSQISSCQGQGVLCDVRMASHPISLSRRT